MWGTLCESGGSEQWNELQNNLGAKKIERKIFVRQGERNLLLFSGSLLDGIKNLAKEFKLNTNKTQIEKAYKTWYGHVQRSKPYPETINVLEKLKHAKIRMCIISNTDSESFYFKIKQYRLGRFFERSFISSKLGYLKPNPKIFQKVQNYLNLPKNQIVMIDDSLYHGVISARKFGWNSLWVARGKEGQDRLRIEDLTGIFEYL